MDDTTNKKYYMDASVLAMFFKLNTEDEIEDTYSNYLNGVTLIIQGAIENFISETNMPSEKAEELRTLFKSTNDPNNLQPEQSQIDKFREYVMDPQLQKLIEDSVNLYNKAIYNRQSGTLNQQQKDALNQYIATMAKLNNGNVNTLITINQLYDTLKKQEEEFNKQKMSTPGPQTEQPVTVQDEPVVPTISSQNEPAVVPVADAPAISTNTPVVPTATTPEPSAEPVSTVASVQQQLGELANQVKTSPYPQLNLSQTQPNPPGQTQNQTGQSNQPTQSL